MNAAQFRSQFSMWAMLAAPLMISDNMTTMSKAALQTVTNKQVIAIDQDPAGIQGAEVSFSGNGEVWAKPMTNGNVAIAFLNRGSTPVSLSTTASLVGLATAVRYSISNVWGGQNYTVAGGSFSATVPASSTVLLRVKPAA
jgi:alpha-galactosidase